MTENYTREQLHEAFSIEYYAHKATQEKMNRAIRNLKAMEYDRNQFEKRLFTELVSKHFEVSSEDMQDFYKRQHIIIWLKGNGYMGLTRRGHDVFIAFLYTETIGELREAYKMLKHKKVYYTPFKGVDKFFNHSQKDGEYRQMIIGERYGRN